MNQEPFEKEKPEEKPASSTLRWSRVIKIRKNSSFKKAAFLIFLLALIWFISTSVQRSGIPALLATFLHPDFENFRNLEPFEEEKSLETQKLLAGLWTYSEGTPGVSPVAKREFLEIIDNGMIWMVKIWDIIMPDGDTNTVKHVVNAYTKPFSYNPDNSAYHSETRVIRQIYIAEQDTCYGASQVDEIWIMAKSEDGNSLTVDRRTYQRFTGDPMTFFPDGDVLDEVERISIARCNQAADMSRFAKRLLALSIEPIPLFLRTQTIESLIRDYYKPLVLDELVRRYDPRAVPDAIPVRFTITPEGAVSNLRYPRPKIDTKRFDDIAELDIRSWLFPQVTDSRDAQTLDLTIQVK